MGKRRRSQGARRREHQQEGHDTRRSAKGSAQDIDENCVLYHSDSEEDGPGNQCNHENNDPDDSSEENADSEPELEIGAAVEDESDVEFSVEFFDPTAKDVPSIQNFVKKYEHRFPAKKKGLSSRQLAQTICSQTRVGTTVRITEDETPIGFITCLNIRDRKDVLKPVLSHLSRLCQGKHELERFSAVLKSATADPSEPNSEKVGLILCERVLNFPPLLVPKLLEALFCEIEWAVEDEPTQKERDSFKFGWYLYITESYYVKRTNDNTATREGNKGEVKKKQKREESETEDISFVRVEDESFHKLASATLSWSIPDNNTESNGVRLTQMAMLVDAGKISAIREMVTKLVGSQDTEKSKAPTEKDQPAE